MKNKCPYCNSKLNIPDKYADKKVRCPRCHGLFRTNPGDTEGTPLQSPTPTQQLTKVSDKKLALKPTDRPPEPKPFWSVVKDFFLFRIYIFPWIIIGTFALCVVLAVLGAILDLLPEPSLTESPGLPYSSFDRPSALSVLGYKWLMVCIGLLWLRVICEWLIIIFRIYSKLGRAQTLLESISAKLGRQYQKAEKHKGE